MQRRHQKVLEEAPAPGHDRRAAQGDGRCRGRGGEGDRLRRRGHRRVHRRAGRPLLLHGDEHAAAGRASGHRDDHRTRSGRVAASRRGGRAAAARAGRDRDSRPRDRGAPLRRGSRPRLPAVDRPHRPLAHARTAIAQVRVDTRLSRRRRGHAVLRPDARQADRLGRGSASAPARRCSLRCRLRGRRRRDEHRVPRARRRASGVRERAARHRADRQASRALFPRPDRADARAVGSGGRRRSRDASGATRCVGARRPRTRRGTRTMAGGRIASRSA